MHMIRIKRPFVASMEQRKNLSPRRKSNPWTPRYRLGALTTKLQGTLSELGHLLGSYVINVLHIARISNVESIIM